MGLTGQNKKKKKILWFKPPISEHVKTNIKRNFLNLLKKHLPSRHRLRKICNKNTVKISYGCMPNMAAILSRHNKTILAIKNPNVHPPCNCRRRVECPVNGDCGKKAFVFKLAYQQIATILPNRTMDAAKRNLNPVFTTIARLSKASEKDKPPSYRKPFGKP